jgi:hypothetical protein
MGVDYEPHERKLTSKESFPPLLFVASPCASSFPFEISRLMNPMKTGLILGSKAKPVHTYRACTLQ